MSQNSKIILGVAGALVAVCLCAAIVTVSVLPLIGRNVARSVEEVVDTSVMSDSVDVAAAAGQIADFDLPAGYRPEFGVHFLGFTFVGYTPGDGHSHLMMMQFPQGTAVDAAGMQRQMRQAAGRGSIQWDDSPTRVVGERAALIKDQEVIFVISEGTNSAGQPFRVMTGVFDGKEGPTFLMIEEPLARWDEAAIDAFLASIR